MGEMFDHSSSFIFEWIFFILAENKTSYKSSEGVDFGKIPSLTSGLAALERHKINE